MVGLYNLLYQFTLFIVCLFCFVFENCPYASVMLHYIAFLS